jgi:hypothetical protein
MLQGLKPLEILLDIINNIAAHLLELDEPKE